MSEQTAQSVNDTKESGRRSHHSAWLAHWMRTNRNTAAETHNFSASGNAELDYASKDDPLMTEMGVPKSAKGVGGIEVKDFSITNENFRMSSTGLGTERSPSSLFKHGQDSDDMLALRPALDLNLDHGEAVLCKSGIQFPSVLSGIPSAKGASSKEYNSLDEGISKNPLKCMKTQSVENLSSFAAPKPLQEMFVEPSSHIVPYKFDIGKHDVDKGKGVVSSSMSRSGTNSSLPNSKFRMLDQDYRDSGSHSADLVQERKMVNHSQAEASMNVCFGEIKSSFMFEAPSTSSHDLPQFGQKWFQKMHKCSLLLFNSQYVASERTKSKKSHYDHHFIPKFPDSVSDVGAMRVCTMMDSVEGMPEDRPRFSQTAPSLVIAKNTGVDLPKETGTFRSPGVFTNTSSDTHGRQPFFGQVVRFQDLNSPTDIEGKGRIGDVKASKLNLNDESSAETNNMDRHFSFHTGKSSATPNKACNKVPMFPSLNIKNLDRPVMPARLAETSSHSSSRTQSLEMDVLLANSVELKRKFTHCLDDPKEDMSSRWVKRLKPSSSKSSPQSTESSSFVGNNSSFEKMSKYLSRIVKHGIAKAGSAPTPMEHHDKGSVLSRKSWDLSKEDEALSLNLIKKDEDLLHSDSWIQRLLSNESRTTLRKPEIVAVCEPQSSNSALDVVENKQFPSIAAMALMGKVMGGFQQCELQKRGSITVWKTKTS